MNFSQAKNASVSPCVPPEFAHASSGVLQLSRAPVRVFSRLFDAAPISRGVHNFYHTFSNYLELSLAFLSCFCSPHIFKCSRGSFRFAIFSSTQMAPEHTCVMFSSAEERPERTCAGFSSTEVVPEHSYAALLKAQVAPWHAFRAFSSA